MSVCLVSVVCTEAHKTAARNAQYRQNKPFHDVKVFPFHHHCDENGDIERIQRYDGHFVGFPAPESGDFAGRIHKEEFPLHKPYEAQKKPQNRRRLRHIRFLAQFAEHTGFRSDVTRGNRIKSAAATKHKTVHRSKARNDDKYHNNRAESGTLEQRRECVLRQRSAHLPRVDFQHIFGRQRARKSKEIQKINRNNDYRAHDKRNRQVPFCVFQFAVYGSRDNPALVCERKRRYARKEAAVVDKTFRNDVRLECVDGFAVDKPHD